MRAAPHLPTASGVVLGCDALIRDMVSWRGHESARSLQSEAEVCRVWYHQDLHDPDPVRRGRAAAERRAWRRYALAAWAMRRIAEGVAARDAERALLRHSFEGLPMEALAER